MACVLPTAASVRSRASRRPPSAPSEAAPCLRGRSSSGSVTGEACPHSELSRVYVIVLLIIFCCAFATVKHYLKDLKCRGGGARQAPFKSRTRQPRTAGGHAPRHGGPRGAKRMCCLLQPLQGHTRVCVHTHTLTQKTCVHTRVCMHVHTHAHNPCTHMYTRRHTRVHAHAHMCAHGAWGPCSVCCTGKLLAHPPLSRRQDTPRLGPALARGHLTAPVVTSQSSVWKCATARTSRAVCPQTLHSPWLGG